MNNRESEEMRVIFNEDGYFFSVDEDGIPDHVYIGLIADDGSLPGDYIKKRTVHTETSHFEMPLYCELTIADVVEEIEETTNVHVSKASLIDGIVNLTLEHYIETDDLYEHEECYECGGTCNYHEDWCPYNYA